MAMEAFGSVPFCGGASLFLFGDPKKKNILDTSLSFGVSPFLDLKTFWGFLHFRAAGAFIYVTPCDEHFGYVAQLRRIPLSRSQNVLEI